MLRGQFGAEGATGATNTVTTTVRGAFSSIEHSQQYCASCQSILSKKGAHRVKFIRKGGPRYLIAEGVLGMPPTLEPISSKKSMGMYFQQDGQIWYTYGSKQVESGATS